MLNIKVVGSGCPSCQKLAELCTEVVDNLEISAEIEKITDVNQFASLGIFMTPGLIIDGKVVSSGKIPVVSTLTHWIRSAANLD